MENQKKYILYCHTNKINGKKYIGITSQLPEKRFRKNGAGYAQCPLFWNAIQKYGWDNFEHKIIKRDLTKYEAKEYEIKYIFKLKLNDRNYGYNISHGGDTGEHMCIPITQYDIYGNVIKNWGSCFEASKELNIGIRKIRKCMQHKNKTCEGYIFIKSCEKLNLLNHTYIKTSKQIDIYYTTGVLKQTFESAKEASSLLNIDMTSIYSCCTGKTKTCGGYIARYNGEDFNKYYKSQLHRKKVKSRNVVQYTKDGAIVKKYNSIEDACNILKFKSKSNISLCCTGKSFEAYGYVWRYEGDEFNKYKTLYRPHEATNKRRIEQYDLNGKYIDSFDSIEDAESTLSIYHISDVCLKTRTSAGGYLWCFKGDSPNMDFIPRKRRVCQYKLDGNLISEYDNISLAGKISGVNRTRISKCCLNKAKTAGGYIWKYAG